MKLNRLSINDKHLFDKFLSFTQKIEAAARRRWSFTGHELSVYAFENIYIWTALFDIYWAIVEDSLCIFFQDKTSTFMYLPPLCEKLKEDIPEKSFAVMNSLNKNKTLSRIENVEEKDISFYKSIGYECTEKSREYLYLRKNLAELKGDKFKSKRASSNYFMKHYQFEYLPFSLKYKNECFNLYDEWAKGRGAKNTGYIYRGMMEDNYTCLSILLDNYDNLAFEGRIIRIGGNLKGFTFGFGLNKDIFCVAYEITDLNVKGLGQYIFQKFCAELTRYKYINIMDDSGLENLKKTKLSYHPAKLIPAYIVIGGKQLHRVGVER